MGKEIALINKPTYSKADICNPWLRPLDFYVYFFWAAWHYYPQSLSFCPQYIDNPGMIQ